MVATLPLLVAALVAAPDWEPDYGPTVSRHAARYGVPRELVFAVIWTESRFRRRAVSRARAMGLMQVKLGTGRGVLKRPRLSAEQLKDPDTNIHAGVKYLAFLWKRWSARGHVDWPLVLASYNAGPGCIDRRAKKGRGPPAGALRYVEAVELELYVRFGLKLSEVGPVRAPSR